MRDVQLYSADQYSHLVFPRWGDCKALRPPDAAAPDVPRYVIEPVAVVLFAIGVGPSLIAGDMESVRESLP